ncbi:hypothetical protein BOTBODRAFT_338359 [Botryobasidium botryosum FD-172 SS1]|uniref:F-box domain-containing protein n=1 Tax=Botryobasidium botryosum (strain FD-172 SS1) TaxID=930990 RepID=A0A067MS41_BOTB1|nr:hypothetical protein BOTBODRAFT_338359 [Botryobasidium botryosum FD-172 SS1]
MMQGLALPREIAQLIVALALGPVPDVLDTARSRTPADATPLLLVCRAWHRTATDLLFRALVVPSPAATARLLDVLARHPALAARVRALHLPVLCRLSSALIRLCPNIRTLCLNILVYQQHVRLPPALAAINPAILKLYLATPPSGSGAGA